jgi:hypothetical protein
MVVLSKTSIDDRGGAAGAKAARSAGIEAAQRSGRRNPPFVAVRGGAVLRALGPSIG